MEDTSRFLKRAAERCGFKREYFIEKNIPTHARNILVIHLFPDIRNEFVLSSLILDRYKNEIKGSKYVILCSWKGHRAYFPYIDEYWSPVASEEVLYNGASGIDNNSDAYVVQQRNLNLFFESVITSDDIKKYYNNGFTSEFYDRLKVAKRFLPMVPSASILDQNFNQRMIKNPGKKLFLMPLKFARGISNKTLKKILVQKQFWVYLLERLLSEGYCPVVCQNHLTHDLSGEFYEKSIFSMEKDLSKVLAMMRGTECVVDFFGGVSRMAIAARTPFVAFDERSRFSFEKEYEIDILCGQQIPKQYIFSFPTILESGNPSVWNVTLFDVLLAKLEDFLPAAVSGTLLSSSESVEEMSLDAIKCHKAKKIGTRLIRLPVEDSLI